MDEAPNSDPEVKDLRFLRILVTVLTATMILGVLTIATVLVIRFNATPDPMRLPDRIVLPEGANVVAFTRGGDWYAVVTDGDDILIYDATTDELRQTVKVAGQ